MSKLKKKRKKKVVQPFEHQCCECSKLKSKCIWSYDPHDLETYGRYNMDELTRKKGHTFTKDWWCPQCYAAAAVKIERSMHRLQKKNDELISQVYDLEKQLDERDVTVKRARYILDAFAILQEGLEQQNKDLEARFAEIKSQEKPDDFAAFRKKGISGPIEI